MSRIFPALAAALLGCMASLAQAAPADTIDIDGVWQARIAPGDAAVKDHPREARWFTAQVPGSIQEDLIAAHRLPDPMKGINEAPLQWVGLTAWEMRKTLTLDAAQLGHDRLDLVFDGLDTFAEVFVNGHRVISADNAHRRWRADVRRWLHAGANEILVRFASPIRKLQPMVLAEAHPLPGEYDSAFGDEPKGKQTSPYIRKPKYQYGWDWGPRIVTIGVWRPARLEAWDGARIANLRVVQESLNDAEARVRVELRVDALHAGMAHVMAQITTPEGKVLNAGRDVALGEGESTVSLPVSIARPQRWWPAGYGAQPLYTVSARIADGPGEGAERTQHFGLRTVELIRGGGAFGFRVNGVPVYAKGANLIPFDSFPNRTTAADMQRILKDARAANMNMIRVWGGGYYLDDSFYDEADKLGLMVWQDFMFGGAVTPPDPAFRENVRIEAEQQVERLQRHPSIVLWAGNNEVLSGWENWSDRKAFKAAVGPEEQERVATGMTVLFNTVLRDAVLEGAPGVPYWPGSPSTDYTGPIDTDANGDRHFWDVWSGSKPVENYLDGCARFMSEFGFQAMPSLATIREFAGDGPLTLESPVLKEHQKFLAGEGNTRLQFYLDARLRKPADFADTVYLTQVNQMQAIEMAVRHQRACAPVTMGSLYWQLNDVWPAISWASIDHAGRWKLLQYAARRFFAPDVIDAEYHEGQSSVVLETDRTAPVTASWQLTAYDMAGRKLGERKGSAALEPGHALQVAKIADADLFGTAAPGGSYAVAAMQVDGRQVSRTILERAAPRAMAYPDPGLSAAWHGHEVTITAKALARAVMLDFGTLDAHPSDNGFDLLPGESVTVTVTSKAAPAALARALTLRTLEGSE